MGDNEGVYFVEWKEEYVSQEKGNRIVHYIMKDSNGKSVLAVVGTERSLRHMVYVVAEEFLNYYGTYNSVQAGFKWRARREVVDWLTSLLAKQQQTDSPSADSIRSLGSSELFSAKNFSADKTNYLVKNLKQSCSDVVWLGAAWTCGKQLKHYPAFRRNGTTIAVQSFVFVMANEGGRYVAYLEDMYEDKKGMKKVKVRWFHYSQEVKGTVRLRNAHPKEVYITPHTQVISVECVDGPAIVLTREHFEKCVGGFPDDLLGRLHLCCRQFRSNKIKPFDLSKLQGYIKQPIFSCLESHTFLNSDGNAARGTKRTRTYGERESFLTSQTGVEGLDLKKLFLAPLSKSVNRDFQRSHVQFFKVDDKIELLCQDSGIRGCWFRCTVLEISRKQMKIQYRDLEDQDGDGNLEEWVPAFRLAAADKLGMRCLGRPTIRPSPPVSDYPDSGFEVGAPVDAWWSDGWWEGVVTALKNSDDVQVYVPGEKKFLDVHKKDLRVSRDWLGGKWVDVKANTDILRVINAETNQSIDLTLKKDDGANDFALKSKVNENDSKTADLPAPVSCEGHLEPFSSPDKDDGDKDQHAKEDKGNDASLQDMPIDGDDKNANNDGNNDSKESELNGIEVVENCTQADEVMEPADI